LFEWKKKQLQRNINHYGLTSGNKDVFLIISSFIPILTFLISRILVPISKGSEKLSSYESGIESIGDVWLQFRNRYYMFALIFIVFMLKPFFFILGLWWLVISNSTLLIHFFSNEFCYYTWLNIQEKEGKTSIS